MLRRKDSGSFLEKIVKSIKHGLNGINYAIEKENNYLILMVISVLILVGGFLLDITIVELAVIILSMGVSFGFEMVNSSIEALADAVTLDKNRLIKISKDCATSALLVSMFVEAVVVGLIYIPKIMDLF